MGWRRSGAPQCGKYWEKTDWPVSWNLHLNTILCLLDSSLLSVLVVGVNGGSRCEQDVKSCLAVSWFLRGNPLQLCVAGWKRPQRQRQPAPVSAAWPQIRCSAVSEELSEGNAWRCCWHWTRFIDCMKINTGLLELEPQLQQRSVYTYRLLLRHLRQGKHQIN